ncbi:MAG: DUF4349 domain-containing protein [Dehalococcoidia bacterium]|nr:DUF4349 domain-containing protein [Dehalococcoidia bacterium]
MKKLVMVAGVLLLLVLLVACANDEVASSSPARDGGFLMEGGQATATKGIGVPAPMPAPAGAPIFAAPSAPPSATAPSPQGGAGMASGRLDVADRKVISTASMVVEVADVSKALTEVRTTAQNLGGFVENLSSSGDAQQQRATVTVRVTQDRFFAAMDHISALGIVLSQNIGSQDVTEQFIDLKARLQTGQRQEQSLLTLLQRAQSVTDILTIERELTRIRADIERSQGQLNFLERRVDLATITVTLAPPEEASGDAPSAALGLEVDDAARTVERVKVFVASQKGIVDSVFISERDGEKQAEIVMRVFPVDFDLALATLASEGEVRSREVREGTPPLAGAKPPSKPTARMSLSLTEEQGWSVAEIVGLVIIIVVAVGVVGGLSYWAYRAGRRHGQRATTP